MQPAECGDLRDVIKVMVTLPRTSHTADAASRQLGLAFPVADDPHKDDGIDVLEAALFGPPDRLPQAMLEETTRDRGRGWLRGYLEGSTAARLLAPR